MSRHIKERNKWPRVALACAAGIVLVGTGAGAVFNAATAKLQQNITVVDISENDFTPTPSASPTVTPEYAPMNLLLMGSDSRAGLKHSKFGDPSVHTAQHSDTTILLHLSADRQFATAVSFPRDTWVNIPECKKDGTTVGGYEGKFNAAFTIGGPGCTVKLVEQITGVNVDHFAVVDFKGFLTAVDAIGGVEVCLTEPVNDPDSDLVLPAGKSVISGEQALGFVRARKTLGDGSDISRIQRQQVFLSSMARAVTSKGLLLDPSRLYSTLDAATQGLTTDPGLADINTLRDLLLSVKDMPMGEVTFITLPWLPRGDGENVVVNDSEAAPIWESILADTPWLTKKDSSGDVTPNAKGKDKKAKKEAKERAEDSITAPLTAEKVKCV